MKLLTVAVPCYNSEAYMEHCLKTLLTGGKDVEILIVDDGSQKDRTPEIADEYEKRYPGIVRAIHQANGGHGAAVNTGLANAEGVYFKVVDSDDWVDERSYRSVLAKLRELHASGSDVDMMICNYVYEKEGARRKKAVRYTSVLPRKRVFTWDEIGHFMHGQYILMHSAIYRTEMLRACHLELPQHTFYVDNIFVYYPLPHVQTLYYMNVDLYRYYIGRSDQSVNEQVMISRIDQQLKVNKLMIDMYDLNALENRKLQNYMKRYLDIMMTVSSMLLIRADTEEALQKKDELWKYLKEKDSRMYRELRFGLFGTVVNLPGKAGRKTAAALYRAADRIFGFN